MHKYFEQNEYAGYDFIDLHHRLTRAYSVVASNLFSKRPKTISSPQSTA